MTVSAQTPINYYTANGATTVFAFSFLALLASDLVVKVIDTSGNVSTKTLNVDYTVSGTGVNAGGSITFGSAPAAGSSVVIYRSTSLARVIDYQNNGDFLAGTVNADFDRIWLALQESYSTIGQRAVRAQIGEVLNDLPAAASRANNLLAFDANGQPVVSAPSSGSAAALAIDLANSAAATKGAGQIGFGYALGYAAGTVGKWLQDLATSTGAGFIGWVQAGTGAVLRTVQAKLRDEIDVKDFGAVSNGTFTAGGSPSGTDNLAAFNAALAAAVSLGISRVKASGVFYLSGKLALPRGITLEGNGTGHCPVFLSGANIRGTVLLIAGSTGDDCVAFEENAGHSGLRNISVYHTNTNAVRGVVSVVGQLYPRMKNVEIASLRRSTGSGLYIKPSATGALYETLWGDFDNVIVTVTGVGTGTEASVRWGLEIQGVSPTSRPGSNCFKGGQFAGCWGGLLMDGAAAGAGPSSCTFHGVSFDTLWDGTYTPQFQSAASGVFGYLKTSCYIFPVVKLMRSIATSFVGCYFESAGQPGTYNDGTNGVQPLIAVNWIDSTQCTGTGLSDASWNACHLYDKGIRSLVSPTSDGHRHDTRFATHFGARTGGVQSVANATWVKVGTATVLFGDDSSLEWDSVNGIVKVRSPGTYLVVGQVEYAGWATANTYAICRVSGGGYTFQGSTDLQQGAGIPISTRITCALNLVLGDTVTFETLHNQGAAQNTSGANTYLSVIKVG